MKKETFDLVKFDLPTPSPLFWVISFEQNLFINIIGDGRDFTMNLPENFEIRRFQICHQNCYFM